MCTDSVKAESDRLRASCTNESGAGTQAGEGTSTLMKDSMVRVQVTLFSRPKDKSPLPKATEMKDNESSCSMSDMEDEDDSGAIESESTLERLFRKQSQKDPIAECE